MLYFRIQDVSQTNISNEVKKGRQKIENLRRIEGNEEKPNRCKILYQYFYWPLNHFISSQSILLCWKMCIQPKSQLDNFRPPPTIFLWRVQDSGYMWVDFPRTGICPFFTLFWKLWMVAMALPNELGHFFQFLWDFVI